MKITPLTDRSRQTFSVSSFVRNEVEKTGREKCPYTDCCICSSIVLTCLPVGCNRGVPFMFPRSCCNILLNISIRCVLDMISRCTDIFLKPVFYIFRVLICDVSCSCGHRLLLKHCKISRTYCAALGQALRHGFCALVSCIFDILITPGSYKITGTNLLCFL